MSYIDTAGEMWRCSICGREIMISVQRTYTGGIPPDVIRTISRPENVWNHLAMHINQIANSLKYENKPKRY